MSIYAHFRPQERPLIDHFFDLKEQVAVRYAPKLTDFLDPRGRFILRALAANDVDVRLAFFGGLKKAERKRALLMPPYFEPQEKDFRLSFFELDYPGKFASPSHPQLLGALTGTGIGREKIGDLIFSGGRIQFVAAEEIESWLLMNLTSVGKTSVSCRKIDSASLLHNDENWNEAEGTVSSMRLDAVLSEIYRLSRAKAQQAVDRGLVKVNWRIADKKDEELREGDMLSVRGFGRSRLISANGPTKKNKIRLRYGKLE